jgi:PAS domain S-box-containing protein
MTQPEPLKIAISALDSFPEPNAAAELLHVISSAQSRFIAGSDAGELFDNLLADLLRLTRSEYGFVGEVCLEIDGTPYLETRDLTDTAWTEETRRRYRGLTRFFNRVLYKRASIISNDPLRDLRNGRGLGGLRSFLGLPLMRGSTLVGIAAIANRPGGYDQSLVSFLEPFLATCASLIEAHRADHRRREVEQAVLDSEARIRAIVDTASDAIVTIDERGIIERVNPAGETMFGYAASELVNTHVDALVATQLPGDAEGVMSGRFGSIAEVNLGLRREVVVRRKDGSTLPAEAVFNEMRIGNRQMLTGILRDVSERKRVERLKSEFVSTVSHELRTPLTSIRGSLGLLAGGMAGSLPPRAQDMLRIALQNSERLGRLINDILDIEKIESGRLEFRPRWLALSDLVRRAIEANQGYAATHQVTLELSGLISGASVFADEDRLTQVLSNLISNAAKFSPANEAIDISIAEYNDVVRVSVRDRGPGIPDDFKPRIFQRFAQADSSDTRQKGGTGLGLSIAKAIVERMNGRIGFEEAEGGGTTFFFELPMRRTPAGVAGAQETDDSSCRILVCEGEADVAASLKRMLEAAGLIADVAPTLARARELLMQSTYGAMTFDLRLGGDEGLTWLFDFPGVTGRPALPLIVVASPAQQATPDVKSGGVAVIDWTPRRAQERRLIASVLAAVTVRSAKRARLLHVEDDPDLCHMVRALLTDVGDVFEAATLDAARQALATESFDLVLLDLSLPDGRGEDLLRVVEGTPTVIFSARDVDRSVATRVQAVLVKTRASEDDLRRAIVDVLGKN